MTVPAVVEDVVIVLGVLVVVVIGLGYSAWEFIQAHRHDDDVPEPPDPDSFLLALADLAGVEPELPPVDFESSTRRVVEDLPVHARLQHRRQLVGESIRSVP